MARYRGPKNRIARKFKCNIFQRLRDPLLHKPNPPGVHGGARRGKKSDYGVQLEEKQKLKAFYGMLLERQLRSYYARAQRKKGGVAHNLIAFLESRLDTVVYRMKFARTIFAAQQLVSHGHILVDGKKVDRRSYQVAVGQEISIREKSCKKQPVVQGIEQGRQEVPEYMEVDHENFRGKVAALPQPDQVPFPFPMDLALVCDFLHAS